MPVIQKELLGAKGFNPTASNFLADPLESQILENILVTTKTKRRRQNYSRWKYDKYCSNAVRLIGTYKNSQVIIKDPDNLRFNSFAAGQSSTIEIRFRIHGLGGYSLKDPIYVASRQIHGTGYTFDLQLIGSTSPVYDTYFPRLILSDGTGTYTMNFSSATTIKTGVWYTLTIVKDNANSRFRCLLDGVFTENVAFAGTPAGAQSVFGVTRTDNTYSDIVIGAKNDFAFGTFSPIDVDEFRIWNEARSDGNVLAFYNTDVPSGSRTNMICYVNFEASHDGYMSTELINSQSKVFFGGSTAFKDSDDLLVFDGSTNYGLLNPTGGVNMPTNQWGAWGGGAPKINEVAFKVLKLKQCRIIGPLEMYYDSGNGKYGFRYKWIRNGVSTTLDSGGLVALADVDSTFYYVTVRNIATTLTLELWVNGTKVNSIGYTTFASAAGETGKNVAVDPTLIAGFAAIRLKWLRTFHAAIPDDTYFSTKYNQEVDNFMLNQYSHGVMTSDYSGATTRHLVGINTNLNANFQNAAPENSYRFTSTKETKQQVGEEYQDIIVGLNTGTQQWDQLLANSTGDPWAAGHTTVAYKEGFIITSLVTRYNAESWRNIKQDKDSVKKTAPTTSLLSGGYDRDRDYANKLELYYYTAGSANTRDARPDFIGGTTKLSAPNTCRYLGSFKALDGSIDVIISISGTAFNVFDRLTKTMTQYPICIMPNSNAPFIGDFLDGNLYLTDGVTKIHVYSYKRNLRVVKWGFDRPDTRCSLSAYINAGPWSAKMQYAYAYYNREIDQFGPLTFPTSAGAGTEITIATNYAVKIDNMVPSQNFYDGVSDIALFRTKDITAGGGIVGHYWFLDTVMGNSIGAMDWSQGDTVLSQRYPIELSTSVSDFSPPNGEFVVAHNKRLWIADGQNIRFSRVGSELHTGVVKAETYIYPPDHYISIQGNRKITGGVSFYDKLLFIFTNSTMDMISGNDVNDFEIRRIHDGIGCVSHRTLVKYGDTTIWLGLDDLYIFEGGKPQPIDPTGRISRYIKETLDKNKLKDSFAVFNRTSLLYELHTTRTDGVPVVIVLDLKVNEFSIFKDIRADYGCEVVDSYNQPVVFYGTKNSFIIMEDKTANGTYQPTSGSVRTTFSSFASGTTINVAASDLQITEGKLIGNTVYIVSNQFGFKGSVFKAVIQDNTASTITFLATEIEAVGLPFVPTSGDDVYIGPTFTRWKSPIHSVSSAKDQISAITNPVSMSYAYELVELSFIHNLVSANTDAFFCLYRDGETTADKLYQMIDSNKNFSVVKLPFYSRTQFLEIEFWHVHESESFETIGYVLGVNISGGTNV